MAGYYLEKSENRYHVRSNSLPARSHPVTSTIDDELNKLKAWEELSTSSSKAETICVGLSGLGDVYECVKDLLHLPSTQQALFQFPDQKWVSEVLDASVKLVDVCGTTRDLLLLMKQSVQDLQSGLRRRKCTEESSLQFCINAFISARKKMKKDIIKGLEALKQMENKLGSSPLIGVEDHLSMVARVLKQVCVITISIFHSLLTIMSVSMSKRKSSAWILVSKFVHKEQTTYEGNQNKNDVESVDATIHAISKRISRKDCDIEKKMEKAKTRLDSLEVTIEDLESGLECMFRHLIQMRVTLLNILAY
ncbi:PREDICTED: uncharacterized protein LOC104611750 [Nelumbo nucifera]|uniref:Protein BPS1, chloroplastic-like n=2 Tax=Nelumbo nucifera TaxID=4432 RepID=A0A822ZMK9_NELNU|nr:PREDICTED: uncharacterized protein LOC104611750 [Nelumbo nucifera]DAD46013.1 TPA_asm: hypothetical protein HUJ06_004243 [Nelumbo nucifera]